MLENKEVTIQNINQGLDFLIDSMNKANIKYVNEKPVQRSDEELLVIAKKHEKENLYNNSFIGWN